jgi:Cu(I)/Ag(I) efflux system membrane fusion protein
MELNMKKKIIYIISSFVLLVILISFTNIKIKRKKNKEIEKITEVKEGKRILFWTCSMHPQIKLPAPGKCPICFMDLIPVYEEKKEDISEIRFTNEERKIAEIETVPVSYRDLNVEIKLLGKVEYDETRISNISAYIPGRIEKLYVNFIGAKVEKGEKLFQIYSPDVYTYFEEYLLSLKRYNEAVEKKETSSINSEKEILESVRKKLLLLGFLPFQIDDIEKKGIPSNKIDFYSPLSGIIIERDAYEGKYINTGDILFRIADIKKVWIKLDVYEKDIPFVKTGQNVEIICEAYPEKKFKGNIIFIDPFLNEKTRTIKVRIEIDNPKEELKPGMFAHVFLKYHLGRKLSIPYTSVLLTGKRAVVFVEKEPNLFQVREIVIGQRAGDFYPVIDGLKEGERVVKKGNFVIDSTLQIKGKESMMKIMSEEKENIEFERPVSIHHH